MVKIKASGVGAAIMVRGSCLCGKNNKHRPALIVSLPTQNLWWLPTAFFKSPHFLVDSPSTPLPSGPNSPSQPHFPLLSAPMNKFSKCTAHSSPLSSWPQKPLFSLLCLSSSCCFCITQLGPSSSLNQGVMIPYSVQ